MGNQLKICTVWVSPNGYSTPEVKVFETEDAIRGGADEIDMVADLGLVKSGDLVVITAGVPLGISGTTNMMKVHVVGHVLLTGEGLPSRASPPGCACASACPISPSASGTGTSW